MLLDNNYCEVSNFANSNVRHPVFMTTLYHTHVIPHRTGTLARGECTRFVLSYLLSTEGRVRYWNVGTTGPRLSRRTRTSRCTLVRLPRRPRQAVVMSAPRRLRALFRRPRASTRLLEGSCFGMHLRHMVRLLVLSRESVDGMALTMGDSEWQI